MSVQFSIDKELEKDYDCVVKTYIDEVKKGLFYYTALALTLLKEYDDTLAQQGEP